MVSSDFRRLAETNFRFPFDFALHHKPLMMQDSATVETKEAQKNVREYLAAIGKRGGLASRRELMRSHAKQMVAMREAKRAAAKTGKR